MTEFDLKLDKWLTEVAEKCHQIASSKDFNLDFYVFQSAVIYNPKLMIIGANPGGKKYYEGRVRTKNDLGEKENTFIKYYNDKEWGRIKSLYDMFKDNGELEENFKNAVITNISYFNSGTFNDLKRLMKSVGNEPINFCLQKNLELINIVKPQNLILMGANARDNFKRFLDVKNFEIILSTKDKGIPLIKKSTFTYNDNDEKKTIPVYIIEHPSAWNGLNSPKNVELKRDKFMELICN